MARAKLIRDFEKDVIRVGHANGQSGATIARVLGRTRQGVSLQIKAMREEGTLDNLPFEFIANEIAGDFDGQE